ncbi:MAG: STAS domain-containing protein [Vicinamibacterales bacterium]
MTIDERQRGVTVLRPTGDITITGTGTTPLADAVQAVLDRSGTRLILDLSHVRYMDSSGLGEMVQALTATRKQGGTLVLLSVTRRLQDLLALTRLSTVFASFEDEPAALASFARPPSRA